MPPGNIVEHISYFPYGQTRINTGTQDVHHKFTGQELDAETGLYFYGARYYDPQLGRFISADTIVPNPRNPQDLNRYSYVANNPLNYIDPTGHSWFSKAWHDVEDSISKTVRKMNDWMSDFFERNDINVNAGTGGTIDSGGHAEPIGYNPETGETFPYMPINAAEVSTVSMGIEINISTVATEYNQYEEAYTSDVGIVGNDEASDQVKRYTSLSVDESLFAGPGASEPYYTYAGGVWTEGTTFNVSAGQTVKIYVKNVNVLGTTINIEEAIHRETQQWVLLPQQKHVFTFQRWGEMPVYYRFNVSTNSDAFTVLYEIKSNWVPGMRQNR